jgi:hypothetical protein
MKLEVWKQAAEVEPVIRLRIVESSMGLVRVVLVEADGQKRDAGDIITFSLDPVRGLMLHRNPNVNPAYVSTDTRGRIVLGDDL